MGQIPLDAELYNSGNRLIVLTIHVFSPLPRIFPSLSVYLKHLKTRYRKRKRARVLHRRESKTEVFFSFILISEITLGPSAGGWVLRHRSCYLDSEEDGNNNMIFMFCKRSWKMPLSLRTAVERQSTAYCAP